MKVVQHKFPAEGKVFGIVQPPSTLTTSEKMADLRVVDPKNPADYCDVHVVEILNFDIQGPLNYFPEWLSQLLFGIDADQILNHIQKKYPEAKKQNTFEIWIVRKF